MRSNRTPWVSIFISAAPLALVALVIAACSESESALVKSALGDGCVINSDCESPFVCVFQQCHVECKSSRDCPNGSLCQVGDKPLNVCQLDKNKSCSGNSTCPGRQACGVDGRCRDGCATARDCVTGQTCVSGVCAEGSELVNGQLISTPTQADAGPGASCAYNSDCPASLVCRNQRCIVECATDSDCALGLRCNENRRCSPQSVGVDAGAKGTSLGCFAGDWQKVALQFDPAMTRSACFAWCSFYNYPLAALNNGNQCWCMLNAPPTTGPSAGQFVRPLSACSVPCGGAPGETCGGPGPFGPYEVVVAR